MSKVRAWSVVVVLALVPAVSQAQDLPEIKARGSLRVVAGLGEQPEMFSFDPGPNPGFDGEMLAGFARLHRLELEVVGLKSFGDRIPALLDGRGDVAVGMINTAERRRRIDFTAEVRPARHLVVSHEPHGVIDTVEQFRAETLGVVKDTTWAKAAEEAGVPASQATQYPDTEPLLQALRSGEITATVMSLSDFTLAAKRYPGLQGGVFIGPKLEVGWGIRKEADSLEAAPEEYRRNYRAGPSWHRLFLKYFGEKALVVLGRARQD